MKNLLKKIFTILIIAIITNNPMAQTTIYVNASASGSNNGYSWADAYTSLHTALNEAESGDQIWVTEGVYYATSSFELNTGVEVYGGFAGTETLLNERNWQLNKTILSGDIGQDDMNTDGNFITESWNQQVGTNADHVVVAPNGLDNTARLDGFIITAGSATTSYGGGGILNWNSSPSYYNLEVWGNQGPYYGGGMLNVSSSAHVENVLFDGNRACDPTGYTGYGGGMYNLYDGSPVIIHVIFNNNQAHMGGGYASSEGSPYFEDVTFSNNNTTGEGCGGGAYFVDGVNATLTDVTFIKNVSYLGGGIYSFRYGSVTMTNVDFIENIVLSSGMGNCGGGLTTAGSINVDAVNVSFIGNIAADRGGGASFQNASIANLTNCLFLGNHAVENRNGGLEASWTSTVTLTNTTFNGNRAFIAGGAFGIIYGENEITATNSIMWGNYPDEIYGSGITISYSNVQQDSSVYVGTGNINSNPRFIESADALEAPTTAGDLRINGYSPCVNAGDNNANTEPTDIRGQARIQNTTIDMGAYEWTEGVDPAFQVIYVDSLASGNNDGSSWTDAFTSLQSAIDAAISGNHIWVAKGTYKPSSAYDLTNTSRYYHFRMKEGVEIYGGFSGTEENKSQRTNYGLGEENETVLSGDLDGDDVVSGSGLTLDLANYSENCYHVIYNPDALTSASVLNGFTVKGGNANGTDPHDRGAGILNYLASPSITDVIFTENGGTYGGGIYSYGAAPCVTNCLIYANKTENGAGIENKFASPTYINTTIALNLASGYGGGMNNYHDCNPTFNNCIIWGNIATTGNQIYASAGETITLNYSCYSNQSNDVVMNSTTLIADNNNITVNPLFVDETTKDFRLFGNSPTVNSGLNSYNTTTTDVRGQSRIQNTTIDMGAYEWTAGTDSYGCEGILYVDVNAVGLSSGYSWTDAFTLLQSALDVASSGDQIWVAKGTYKPSSAYDLINSSRYYHFRMIDGVEIYGGFTGMETSINDRTNFGIGEANETILSGDLYGDDIVSGSGETLTFSNNSENCYHVIYNPDALTSSSVLNGFTVKGGNGNGAEPFDRGSGVFNSSTSPSLTNVTFTANCGQYAGGICNLNSSPIITNCLIYGNKAFSNSGGIENSTSSSPVLINTTIAMNIASYNGGGMMNHVDCSPVLNNCIIWGNIATTGNQMYMTGGGTTTLNYSCYSNNENDIVTASGSDVFTATNNNVTTDPLFVNAEIGDLRIHGFSSCTNNGNNSFNSEIYDIRGQDRIQDMTIDMGAYEWTVGIDPPLQIIFVDLFAGGNNDGSSWADAYTSLQSALDVATSDDQIWVAKGTYKPSYDYGLGGGSRYNHFRLNESVDIYGGFAGIETGINQRINYSFGEENETILSGDIGTPEDNSDNCYHVIYLPEEMGLTQDAVLDGFTITCGNANHASTPHNQGGGIFINNSSPTLTNNTFYSNNSTNIGAGAYFYASNAILSAIQFISNTSSSYGGGAYFSTCTPVISDVEFTSNTATNGGGLYLNSCSSANMENITFSNNNATTDGGGLSTHSSNVTITNGLFKGNTCANNGAAINFYSSSIQYNAILNNVTISGNQAGLSGGGIRFTSDNAASTLTINNSVIWDNIATNSGNELSLVSTGSTTMNYSCYKNLTIDVEVLNGTFISTNNNITFDPHFIDASTQDFRLLGFSPAVNSGLNSYNATSTDLRGQTRIQNTTIDMGAYEWTEGIDPYIIGGILYVDINAEGANNGGSWTDAFTSLQTALDIAVSGDQIWVTKGTYNPSYAYNLTNTPRCYHFRMVEGVEIYGGFAGTEVSINERTNFGIGEINETILSGDLNVNDNFDVTNGGYQGASGDDNCYHLLYHPAGLNLTSTSVLDGFTITGGNANEESGTYNRGSGLYQDSSSPTIRDVIFISNSASDCGGAIFNRYSSPIISKCEFTGNKAHYGGGIYNYYCTSDLILTNCLFSYNYAQNGAAILNNNSSPEINNTTIAENTASGYGGGINNLCNCISVLNNCIIWGNNATTGNQFYASYGGITTLNYSCYSNQSGDVEMSSLTFTADNNNITADPIFVNATNNDFRLCGNSPAVNTGQNSYNTLSTDIRGETRIQNTSIDMGAYEWTSGVDPITNVLNWTGNTNSDWNVPTNWSADIVPTQDYNVVIPNVSNDPVIAPSCRASCHNLTINSGATLTIQSNASGTGSLIVSETSSGNVIFKRYVDDITSKGDPKWHYVSSPVEGQLINDTWMTNNSIATYNSSKQFFRWDEPTNYWIIYGDGSFSETVFGNAEGYCITRDGAGKLSFEGTLRTDNVNYAATYNADDGNGFNLVGNPFTCSLMVTTSASETLNFLTVNTALLDDSYEALYIWDEQADYCGNRNDYKVISNSGISGYTEIEQDYIQPGQAFMVKLSSAGNLQFNKNMQAHATVDFYKNSKEIWPSVELIVENNDLFNSTAIGFNENMTKGLDPSYDVGKLKGNPDIALYTKLIEDNGIDFAIQALPYFEQDYSAKVGLDITNAGEYVFKATIMEQIPENIYVYFEDKLTAMVTNLKETDNYTCVINDAGSITNRFVLHFTSTPFGNDEIIISQSKIQIWSANKIINILNPENKKGTIRILNMYGQKLVETNLNGNDRQEVTLNIPTGNYIVNIIDQNFSLSKKVFVK